VEFERDLELRPPAGTRASASRPVLPGLARDVAGLLRGHGAAALAPAALLGAGADAILLLRDHIGAVIVLGIALAVAFELYVGYVELIVAADRSGEHPAVLSLLRAAVPFAWPLLLASVVAVTLPLAATGLLVVPGLWLLTRWSLFAPAVVHERLPPRAALRRSARLVDGAFWAVAASVTISVLIEHAVIHGAAHGGEALTGSLPLGLVITAVATTAVSGPAAFTVSVVYERRAGVA